MLHDFLDANRDELVARCRSKVQTRTVSGASERELSFGITVFLEQLIRTLVLEQGDHPDIGIKVSGPASGIPALSEMAETASRHGNELLLHGFTVEDVVHDYGDLCQAITDLAFEESAPIGVDEFRTLNRCLDNAIATAVTEFGYQRTKGHVQHSEALNEQLGSFAHELRNSLSTATLAVAVIKAGNVGMTGATGTILDRSLIEMRTLIDRSLAAARLGADLVVGPTRFSLSLFITQLKLSASLEASIKGCNLIVAHVDPKLALAGDRDLLLAAVGNLLQNAFKFSREQREVSLNAYAAGDRILIDVEDCCGGLPDGVAESMFRPFAQMGADRTGIGLGLSIARRSVEANDGRLSVRNVPGTGCVFNISLPRHSMLEADSDDATSPTDLLGLGTVER
jgi:signal transduction histidine kinase